MNGVRTGLRQVKRFFAQIRHEAEERDPSTQEADDNVEVGESQGWHLDWIGVLKRKEDESAANDWVGMERP
jgi:hypothetical protein